LKIRLRPVWPLKGDMRDDPKIKNAETKAVGVENK
jgi:hypothetical protein